MLSTRYRKTVLTTVALMASTALLTACQGGDGGDSDGKKSSGSSSSSSQKDSQAKSGAEARNGAGDEKARPGGEGVTGTWFGNVSLLGPGKYTVSGAKGKLQAFFTAESTDIQGTGDICGDAEGQAATKCTEAQLEAAAKKGVTAKVEMKNGTAVRIVDDRASTDNPGGKGVSGTWFGNVSYLAPGKYTVSGTKGKLQAFFTAGSTDIQGAGDICGDADGQAATKCTEAELEAAAKKGVSAKVEIKNGTAVSIVEDH